MERKLAEELVEIIEAKHGMGSAEIYEDYSGRFMYGSTTTAVVADCSPMELTDALLQAMLVDWTISSELKDDVTEALKADQLGRGYVYY